MQEKQPGKPSSPSSKTTTGQQPNGLTNIATAVPAQPPSTTEVSTESAGLSAEVQPLASGAHGVTQEANSFCATLQNLTGLAQIGANASSGSGSSPSAQKVLRAATETTAIVNGQAAQSLLLADLNGDGIPDAIYVASAGIGVQVLNSDGSVRSSNQFPTGFSPDPAFSTIAAADFNGDGKLDLAVSDPGMPGASLGGVATLLGNGDGTFQAARYFPAGQNPSSIAAADFNGDGKVDLAAASSVTGTIAVLAGDGDGTLGGPASYGNGGDSQAVPVSLFALDLNGDGRPDLAVANEGFVTVPNSSISTLLNTGTGFKPAFKAPLPLALIPSYLAYTDLNNDGYVDLVAVSESASATIVMFGKGDGTFQSPVTYAAGDSAASVAVLSLVSGVSLVITPDIVENMLWFTTVSPRGVLGFPTLNLVGGMPTGVATADLNGDGQPDAVVTGGSSDVTVLLGQSTGGFNALPGNSLAASLTAAAGGGDRRPEQRWETGRGGGQHGAVRQLRDGERAARQRGRYARSAQQYR